MKRFCEYHQEVEDNGKKKREKIKQLVGDYPPYVLSDKIKEIINYLNNHEKERH